MNTCSIRLAARVLLFALTLTAPSGAAPDSGEEGASYVWTGVRGNIGRAPRIDEEVTRFGSDGPSATHRARPDEHVSRLRAELAELRLAEATEGPAPERDAARLELWIRACDEEPFAGQGELLVELALERAEALAARGESEAALAATQELLVPARLAAQAGELELREADAAWLERAGAWLADPALVAMRAKLAPTQESRESSEDVEAVIERHLRDGNVEAVLQFGLRAVPVAERVVRAEPDAFPGPASDDPLTVFFKLSEERGARVALEVLERSGDVVPVRVLRAMREANVLKDDGTWDFVRGPGEDTGMRSARLREPIWRDVLEVLCARPVVAMDACAEVGFLVSMDALTPGLSAFLERAIRGEDAALSQRALAALSESSQRPSARTLLERLLSSDSEQVRTVAAENLSEFEECPALWACAEDPSVDVRSAIVRALRPEQRQELSISGVRQFQLRGSNKKSLRGLDRGGMRALEVLLADAEPSIYLQALDILRDNSDIPMSAERLRALALHPDARVRSLLPHVVVGALPDPAVLEILARDSDLSVLNSVDSSLRGLASVGPLPTESMALKPGWRVLLDMSTAWDDGYLPALRRRLDNPALPRDMVGGVIQVAARTPQGAEFLTRWACDGAEPTQAAYLVVCFSSDVSWDRGVTPWKLIDPDRARELLAVAWGTPGEPGVVRSVAKCLLDRPEYRTAAAGWLADESLPAPVRFLGAWVSAPDADDAWRAAVLALLSTEDALGREQLRGWGGHLQAMAKSVGDRAVAGRLIGDLAESSVIPEEIEESFVEGLAAQADLTPEIAQRALGRWSSRAPRFDGVFQLAADSVLASEEDPKVPLFEAMLRAPSTSFTSASLKAIGRLHLRAHLPLLARALKGEFFVNEVLRSNQQARAAEALACYLDDEAAEILLRGVGTTTDPSVRDACFAALDTIRRYQDEKARWTSRADAGRARAEAIAELVGLIDAGDAAQKVEAVRALGTLEALEELPRLVRLAGSRDAALAKAAKEALERIHAAGGD